MNRLSKSIRTELAAWQTLAAPSRAFSKVLRAFAGRYKTYAELRRQRRALSRLDDRLLEDIGVDRRHAEREAAKTFWRE